MFRHFWKIFKKRWNIIKNKCEANRKSCEFDRFDGRKRYRVSRDQQQKSDMFKNCNCHHSIRSFARLVARRPDTG